jgi:DNA-binding MarR family transcriptional regulator
MAKRKQGVKPTKSSGSVPANLSIGLCNCGVLRKASRRLSQLYDEALAGYGIKITQRSILEHIVQAGAPSVSELADAMTMDRSAMTRNLQPLEREGWIELLVDPEDRRSRRVAITAAGRKKLAETFDAWKASQTGFERAFGRAAAADLRVALRAVISDDFVRTYHANVSTRPMARK